jgi:hypothetical protein
MLGLHGLMIHFRETSFWGMNHQHQHTLPLFKLVGGPLVMTLMAITAISYSPLNSPLPVLLLHSCGVLIASFKRLLPNPKSSPLYSQSSSNISTPMAAKMEKISSECSREVTVLRSGFSTTLELIEALHIALQGAFSVVKKSLSLNIQMVLTPQSTQELL